MAYGFYGFYQYRMKNIKAIEQIRDGIANDFHDDLGSTLSVISIYSEVALKKSETDLTATKRIVEDMGIRARAMVQSMSDMVWIIKPENDTLAHLVQRMEEFSYPVAEAKEIQLVFKMDEGLSALKIDMLKRKSLFLIFKEAFNNSVKYSGAGKIEVILDIEQKKMLTMQIIDNGAGFNLAKKKHGNGLASMQKRAKEISGTIKIETATGAGTSVYINCSIA
jgi:two-component system sensor histidine kinase UhpB